MDAPDELRCPTCSGRRLESVGGVTVCLECNRVVPLSAAVRRRNLGRALLLLVSLPLVLVAGETLAVFLLTPSFWPSLRLVYLATGTLALVFVFALATTSDVRRRGGTLWRRGLSRYYMDRTPRIEGDAWAIALGGAFGLALVIVGWFLPAA